MLTSLWRGNCVGQFGSLSAVWSPNSDGLIQFFWLVDMKTVDPTQEVWFTEGIYRAGSRALSTINLNCFTFLLPSQLLLLLFFFLAWMFSLINCLSTCEKTSSQNRCLLQWREAVLHGTMDCCSCCQRRVSRNKSFYQFVLSEKQKRRNCKGRTSLQKCISVKEFNIRIA